MSDFNYSPPRHRCVRCGNEWYGRLPTKPKLCPQCKNRNWDRPPVRFRA